MSYEIKTSSKPGERISRYPTTPTTVVLKISLSVKTVAKLNHSCGNQSTNSTKYSTCINPNYSCGTILLEAYDTNAPITRILSHIAAFQKLFCHYSSLWMRLQHIDQLWIDLEYTCQTLHLCKRISYFVVSWRHHTLGWFIFSSVGVTKHWLNVAVIVH